jgi:hypothetical protein
LGALGNSEAGGVHRVLSEPSAHTLVAMGLPKPPRHLVSDLVDCRSAQQQGCWMSALLMNTAGCLCLVFPSERSPFIFELRRREAGVEVGMVHSAFHAASVLSPGTPPFCTPELSCRCTARSLLIHSLVLCVEGGWLLDSFYWTSGCTLSEEGNYLNQEHTLRAGAWLQE